MACQGRSERPNESKTSLNSPPTPSIVQDDGATLDELREAVTTLEDTARIARRVLGGAHPVTKGVEGDLRNASVVLAARETPSTSA